MLKSNSPKDAAQINEDPENPLHEKQFIRDHQKFTFILFMNQPPIKKIVNKRIKNFATIDK